MKSLENTTTPPETGDDTRIVQSVARAVRLLKAMSRAGRPMSLSDLARAVEMSKPAAYHLLRTLVLEGLVRKRDDSMYELSWGLWELGASVTRNVDLVQVSRLHLDRLAESTGEAVLLSILDGDAVLYLDRGNFNTGFNMLANSGRRSSLHANASGKVLLSHCSRERIDRVLAGPLKAFTSATITDPQELRRELGRVREQEFASCWQEQELGVSSVAVPIRDYSGDVVAALALAGPAGRVNRQSLSRLVSALSDEARQISRQLGARAH